MCKYPVVHCMNILCRVGKIDVSMLMDYIIFLENSSMHLGIFHISQDCVIFGEFYMLLHQCHCFVLANDLKKNSELICKVKIGREW